MSRRVVVTGIGVVSPIGNGRGQFWANCLDGAAAVEPIPAHWRDYGTYSSPIWAPLAPPDYTSFAINRAEKMQMDTVQLLSLVCGEMALADAGLCRTQRDEKKNTFTIDGLDSKRCGVFVGTGNGGLASYTQGAATHLLAPVKDRLSGTADSPGSAAVSDAMAHMRFQPRFNPFSVAMTMPNACSAVLSIKYSLNGPSVTLSSACASGTSAIGNACRSIMSGHTDMALAGGAEYLADPYGGIFRGFDAARTLVQTGGDIARANRPFDKARTGFLFSAGGAAVLVLEEARHAEARGARPIAEIAGYAETCDAHTIMGMAPDGAQIRSMYAALFDEAGCGPGDVDYINTHGTGTVVNDETESAVIEEVFGRKPLVNSTKSLIGHTIGAAGAIEACVAALSIQTGAIHASLNLDEPIRDLNFVTGKPRRSAIGCALTQSFGFGGHIAGLLLTEASSPQ